MLRQSPSEIANKVELFSFHSVSKGFIGECGRRGGYMELANVDPEVTQQIYKLASISLCPNLDGQIMVDLMVNPPKEGDPSYPTYATFPLLSLADLLIFIRLDTQKSAMLSMSRSRSAR